MTPSARRKARLLAVRAALVKAALEGQGDDVAVAKKAGVDKSTVGRWRKGNISYEGLEQLASGLRLDIVLKFPAHGHPSADAKESPPAWAEGLETRIALEVARQLVDPKSRTALRELVRRTESTPPPSGATAPEDVSAPDQAG
jgi:transposase-like protein